jgi:protein-tyrosine phosphatase
MIPLVDMHCHLLAGLDDGPRTREEAVAMCRMAYEEGTRVVCATAHQNEHFPDVTPDRIRTATRQLTQDLMEAGIDLTVAPCAEVMASLDLEEGWRRDEFLSVADRGQYVLLEMPDGLFVDLSHTVEALRRAGVRPILAHPERHAELLHEPGRIEDLVRLGCLVQVSSASTTKPRSRQDERALRGWFRRGVAHLLGSDGHSPRRRPPLMAAAYEVVGRWAGTATADRVCSTNGAAVVHGLPLRVPEPEPPARSWLSLLW